MWYAHLSSFLGLGTANMDGSEKSENTPDPDIKGEETVIARQLTGELYCIGCNYDLKGLSIRSNCPECGIPVRATILGIVDPLADEIVPLSKPKLTAIGLNAWSMGALVAVLMIWVLRIAEVLREYTSSLWTPSLIPWIGVGALVASMIGGVTMIRIHRKVSRFEAIRAALAIALYAPMITVYAAIYHSQNSISPSPLLDPGSSSLDRSVMRVLLFLFVAGIIWGLRPSAIGLAVRSVVVRTGRVDRQSLYAVLASLGIAAIGDLIQVFNEFVSIGLNDVLSIVSVVVISLGSVLFTVGMINICIDTIRLYPVLVRPGVGLHDIFETNQQKTRRSESL